MSAERSTSALVRLRAWLGIARARERDTPISSVLKTLLGKHRFELLQNSEQDWRKWPENAALVMQIPISQLLTKMAKILGIRFILKLNPIDLDTATIPLNIGELRECAAYPVMCEGKVVAVAAVDPMRATVLLARWNATELVIGSWSEIANAIARTEQQLGDLHVSAHITAKERVRSLAQKAFELILEELEKYRSNQVHFGKRAAGFGYHFKTDRGAEAYGIIDERIWASFEEVARERASTGEFSLQRTHDGSFILSIKQDSAAIPSSALSLQLFHTSDSVTTKTIDKSSDRPILIVEDNATFAAVIGRFLQRQNLRTIHCMEGKAACALLDSGLELPSLIVCDLHMPTMNGIEFLIQLRRNPRFQNIPAIVLTSDDDSEVELQALNAGANLLLPKTIDPRIFCAHVARLRDGVVIPDRRSVA